jgi:hypothetical protein
MYKVKKTGECVEIGDILHFDSDDCFFYGTLTEEMADLLIKVGVLEKKEYPQLGEYVAKVAKRLGLSDTTTVMLLTALRQHYKQAVISIILKEIAIDLDKKYPDHIRNSKDIYVISAMNMKIYKAVKDNIKSFDRFAAFRTLEDAKKAIEIVTPLLDGK